MHMIKDLRFLIVSYCVKQLVCGALYIPNYHLIHDKNCDLLENKFLHFVERSSSLALDCARKCLHHEDCKYIRVLSSTNGSNWCEIFSFNKSTVDPSLQLQRLHLSAVSSHGPRRTCYIRPNVVLPSNGIIDNTGGSNVTLPSNSSWNNHSLQDHDNSISKSRLAAIDTNDPTTQKKAHMGKFRNRYLEAKAVYLDSSGVYHALVINSFELSYSTFKGCMVYAMNKSIDGFHPNAARIAYPFIYTGTLRSSFVDLSGRSWTMETDLPEMKIYFPQESEYTLVANKDVTNVSTLISYIRQGFKVYDYKHTLILDDESAVMFYRVNEKLEASVGGMPFSPLSYWQQFRKYIGSDRFMANVVGSAQNVTHFKKRNYDGVALSPLWRPAVDTSLDHNERIAAFKRLMFKGHRFRVSYRDSFFDVDDVISYGRDDTYFLLPQHFKGSPRKPSDDFVGLRAVVSLWGNYAWCSHELEGEAVLDSGFDTRHPVHVFVDKNEWIPVLSVYSNGTVATGRVSDVANAALGGKDVNVLLEWLTGDKARLLRVIMVSVKGFGTPDVIVSAESFVSWNLKEIANAPVGLNPRCDLEKVLMKSNGDEEVLIYNVHRREPVIQVTDIRSTWFVF